MTLNEIKLAGIIMGYSKSKFKSIKIPKYWEFLY